MRTNSVHFRAFTIVLLTTLLLSMAGFVMAWTETGAFCYALDDSFIMMALAKNLAFHQSWALSPHHFSSTASSPLFAVILAGADLVFGEHIWMPLLINVLSLTALFGFLTLRAAEWKFNGWQTAGLLLGLLCFMPVPVLLFGSMEHILHTLIALICLWRVVEKPQQTGLWLFLLLGSLLSGIRYEGLFEGGILVLWLWRNKYWMKGWLLGTGLMIPVCWLGFYSLAQGWFFLPNSLILKAYGMNIQETGSLWGFFLSWLSKAGNYPHCIVAMLSLWLVKELPALKDDRNESWTGIVLLVSVLHFMLARYGHVYRYEGYLMALAWVAIWKTLVQRFFSDVPFRPGLLTANSPTKALLIICLAFSPFYRFAESFANGSKAIVNIFEQQVQTARFVKKFYNHSTVAAIDVGAIAYYSDCRLEDLWGLGTMDFARLKLENRYRPAEIDSVCRKLGVELVIGYGNPVREPGWVRAESWAIQDNRVCARDTVDFYALSPSTLPKLENSLSTFRKELPPSVLVITEPQP